MLFRYLKNTLTGLRPRAARLVAAVLAITLTFLPPCTPLAVSPAVAWQQGREYAEATINGQKYFGFWLDPSHKVFVVCDPSTGEPTGTVWVNRGRYVTKKVYEFAGYEVQYIQGAQRKLYSVETPGPWWKGDIHLSKGSVGFNVKDLLPLEVVPPYNSNNMPEYWRWIVFQAVNPNDWPVRCLVRPNGAGEKYSGEATFEANQKRWLRLVVPAGWTGTNKMGFHTTVVWNGDPWAPTKPVDYVNNPPADDGTGPCWTYSESQGMKFVSHYSHPYYSSLNFWALVPGFKRVPVWNPDPADPHWGTLSFTSVPGYQWVKVPKFRAYLNDVNAVETDATDAPFLPYFVDGYEYGPLYYQPSGPYRWEHYWQVTIWSKVAEGEDDGSTLYTRWPYKVVLAYGDPNIESTSVGWYTVFFADYAGTRLVVWNTQSNTKGKHKWYEYVLLSTYETSGYNGPTHPRNVSSQQEKLGFHDTLHSSTLQLYRLLKKYYQISGSYAQILSASSKPSSCLVGYFFQVYNPTDYPVTVSVTGAKVRAAPWRSADYGYLTLSVTDSKVVPPRGYAVFSTTAYGLPTVFFNGSARAKDTYISGTARALRDSSHILAIGWTASGLKLNIVGYDYGKFYSGGKYGSVSGSSGLPGFCGAMLDYEKAMTPQELVLFLQRKKESPETEIHPQVAAKVQSILNYGYATWTAERKIKRDTDNHLYYDRTELR